MRLRTKVLTTGIMLVGVAACAGAPEDVGWVEAPSSASAHAADTDPAEMTCLVCPETPKSGGTGNPGSPLAEPPVETVESRGSGLAREMLARWLREASGGGPAKPEGPGNPPGGGGGGAKKPPGKAGQHRAEAVCTSVTPLCPDPRYMLARCLEALASDAEWGAFCDAVYELYGGVPAAICRAGTLVRNKVVRENLCYRLFQD